MRLAKTIVLLISVICLLIKADNSARGHELDSPLRTLRQVPEDGERSPETAKAWQQVVTADAEHLPAILAAIDNATPLGSNWLRSAVDAIAEREMESGHALPKAALEEFVLDLQHKPRARRLAFQWLTRIDPAAADRIVPKMLQDPSVEFRREAVARLLNEADTLQENKEDQTAIAVYRQALDSARDKDQIDVIAEKLRGLKQEVDLPRHFGFLMNWHVIGPFDNSDRTGFSTDYPPEHEIDLSAEYEGKTGSVGWVTYSTTDDYGMVDLNQPFGSLKETVGYAWTTFTSDREQEVELRLGCKNAWKLWVNGEFVFGRDEYHRGMQLDQYRLPVTLQSGRNEILVKACQNEQDESWTVEWQYQLRVCDSTGTAILSK